MSRQINSAQTHQHKNIISGWWKLLQLRKQKVKTRLFHSKNSEGLSRNKKNSSNRAYVEKRGRKKSVCVRERERERESLFYNSLFLSVLLFWYQFSFSLFLLFSMKQTLSFLFVILFYSKSVSCFLNSLCNFFVSLLL